MLTQEVLKRLLPAVCEWAKQEEQAIADSGIPLTEDQIMDAVDAGVRHPDWIRLQKVIRVPSPEDLQLDQAIKLTGLLTSGTLAITLGHGIYIRADFWENRKLLIHEFAHVMQYERLGGIEPFLSQYLSECITYGYQASPLEQEAIRIQQEIK